MMHKLCALHWVPGCVLHAPDSELCHHFSVTLYVNLISWKILTYTLRLDDKLGSTHKPSLFDTSHPYRLWLWQAEQQTLYTLTDLSNLNGTFRLEFDSLAPFRIVRKLSWAKVEFLTDLLMKAFYDLSSSQLCYMYNPTKIPTNLLYRRIDRAIKYANQVTSQLAK